MNYEKVLPSVIIAISSTASVVYFVDGDIRRSIYWLAAAILASTVTF